MLPYTELRKAPRIDLVANVPLAAPLTVYLDISSRCNLSCSFCPQSLPNFAEDFGGRQHMDIKLFRSLAKQIRKMSLKSLKLYFFGEPLLHPDIYEILVTAAHMCQRVELITNGMALTENKAQALVDGPIHYVRVSLYAHVDQTLVRRNVARLWAFRKQHKKTLPHICIKVFSQAELARAKVDFADISDEIMVEGFHTIGSEFVSISQQPVGKQKACPYPFYNLVIKSNGDVVPCCVAWEKSLTVGNANTQTLDEIWKGEALANIHRLHLEGRRSELAACNKCDTLFNSPDNIDALSREEYDSRL